MYQIDYYFDTRKQKANGTFPLKIRLSDGRSSRFWASGFSFQKKEWNAKKQRVNAYFQGDLLQINTEIAEKLKNYRKRIKSLTEKRPFISLGDLKKALLEPEEISSEFLLESIKSIEDDFRKKDKNGTANSYKNLATTLRAFLRERKHALDGLNETHKEVLQLKTENGTTKMEVQQYDIALKAVNLAFIEMIEDWYLYDRKNKINGLRFIQATLRSSCNKIIKKRMMPQDWYPYKYYTIKTEKTKKRYLKPEELKRFLSEKPLNYQEDRAKKLFIASLFLSGMSFVDMAHLKVRNIRGSRIEYTRSKTKDDHISVEIPAMILPLIESFKEEKSDEEYLFPILTNKSEKTSITDAINNTRKKFNDALKSISKRAGVSIKITSLASRHTYATKLLLHGAPLEIISQALGHESTETTKTYISSFPNHIIDEYSKQALADVDIGLDI